MNRMLKKSLALVMALVMVFSIAAVAAPAASDVQVTVLVDGKALTFTDATPQLKDDRTYVPYRAVFEALALRWPLTAPPALSPLSGTIPRFLLFWAQPR